jgi:hypothetical protein
VTSTIQRHGLGLTWLESDTMARAAHAVTVDGRVWLIDPFIDEAALAAAAELGTPAAVIQLLDRHNRDCAAIAQRLDVALLRLPAAVPDSPFEAISVVARPWWKEVALWCAPERTLIVAEAVGTGPVFALGRPVGVHPLLRLTPPRSALGGYRPKRLLVGHGPALETGVEPALAQALSASRTDIPKLVLKLPTLGRAG